MEVGTDVTGAILTIAAVGGVGGLIGGFFAGRRATATGSVLMGAIGGITLAAVARVVGLRPLLETDAGFSIVYGLGGGAFLAWVVGSSNR